MSVQVTWPRKSKVSPEEKLLRRIFEHVGVAPDQANNATLISMVERYKREEKV